MAVIRSEEKVNFTVISNEIIENPNLTAEATGMLIYMLSKPAHWVFNKSHLQTAKLKCGKDKLTRIFKELEQEGYLKKVLQQDKSGKFSGVDWIVTSNKDKLKSPESEKPEAEKPADGKTATSKNRIIVNNNINNIVEKKSNKKNDYSEEFENFWKTAKKHKNSIKTKSFNLYKKLLKKYSSQELLEMIKKYNEANSEYPHNLHKTLENHIENYKIDSNIKTTVDRYETVKLSSEPRKRASQKVLDAMKNFKEEFNK